MGRAAQAPGTVHAVTPYPQLVTSAPCPLPPVPCILLLMATFAAIITAAGKSTRFGDKNYKKPFAMLGGRAVWLHSIDRFQNHRGVKQTIITVAPEDREDFDRKFGANVAIMGVDVVEGGEHRTDSIQRALERVKSDIDFVAVHDAARPCIADKWIEQVFEAAERTGAAILAAPVAETLKRVDFKKQITATVDRASLWTAQTPQVFRRSLLIEAYAKRGKDAATDDAQLVERLGHAVTVVACSAMNLKITTRDDLKLAEQVLKVLPKPKPDGFNHPFAGDDLFR
jgi:2-C-methyl-D-erythritol 4-phosphate cytidylyltransferase